MNLLEENNTNNKKYLLYIDILGFSDRIEGKNEVKSLYNIIDSLNVHRHDAFKTIVFSDTILVYNKTNPINASEKKYLIMFLCEFAQDLLYRLIGRDLHFRAYIAEGEFNHHELNNIESFYGDVLIRAYRRESEIQCTGLFIENNLLGDCDIFLTSQYDSKCYFVHIIKFLERISYDKVIYPISSTYILDEGLHFLISYDIRYLENVYKNMNNMNLPPKVRIKYLSTWYMIRSKHKLILDTLEINHFNPRCISNFDWSEAMNRIGTDKGHFS